MASRCLTWNRAFEGIAHYIKQSGLKVNEHNFKVESNIFNTYCKEKRIKGTFSERVLKVSDTFIQFKIYIKELKIKNNVGTQIP